MPLRILRALLLAIATLAFALNAVAGPNDGLPKPATPIDRATPRRTLQGYFAATRAGDWVLAAHFLDLRGLPRNRQESEGPELAQKLAYVLERKLAIDLQTVPDVPEAGAGVIVAGTIFVDDDPVPITLSRVRFDDGVQRWLIARTTVSVIPELYKEFGASGWEDRLPRVLVTTRIFGVEAWQWLALSFAFAVSYVGGWLLGSILIGLARRIAMRTKTPWDDELVLAAKGPTRLLAGLTILQLVDDPLRFKPAVQLIVHRIAFPIFVVAVAWALMAAIGVGTRWILSRLPSDPEAELKTRGLKTQLAVMRRVTSVILVVCASAVILMQFEIVRSVGVSLLASAGLVGVVLGFAAQKSIAGVIAGIQLSITQPIRIGDSVVIEGEWGTIEEINLTYVVVKVWDERRLVVPIVKFLETPFQNWTKVTPEILGTVFLSVDFATPVDRVREELEALVKPNPKWDGRALSLLVTDLTAQAMVLRVVVSARNAGDAWELRCLIRERLMRFLAELEGGKYLVQVRRRDADPTAPVASTMT